MEFIRFDCRTNTSLGYKFCCVTRLCDENGKKNFARMIHDHDEAMS